MKANSLYKKPINNPNNNQTTSFVANSTTFQKIPSQTFSFLQRVKSKLQQSFHSLLSTERIQNKTKCGLLLEQIREERQEIFDKQIEQILKPFLIKYFKATIDEIRLNNDADILPKNIYKHLSYCLLKHTRQRYKRKSNNYNGNKNHYSLMQQREIMLNETSGKYRKLFEGFDENRPYIERQLIPSNFLEQRQQVYWNIDSLIETTKFVFDFECNKAFGINKKHKYRLVSHHPHLIRYLIDAEDYQWFQDQQLLKTNDDRISITSTDTTEAISVRTTTTTTTTAAAATSSSSSHRILLLVLEQILELPDKYSLYRRQCKNLDLSTLRSFTLPEFILRKMRLFFIRLQIKSDGFITTVPPTNQSKRLTQLNNMAASNELSSNFDSLESTICSTGNEHSTSFSTISPIYDSDKDSTSSGKRNIFIYM